MAAMEEDFGTVLEAVLETEPARALIAMLDTLPETAGVLLRATYMIANHDRRFSHYPGLQDRLRARSQWAQANFACKVDLRKTYGVLVQPGHAGHTRGVRQFFGLSKGCL